MVMAWITKNEVEAEEENQVTVGCIVKKILGYRKFNGVPHNLVKWKGYKAVKDRTWEPCEMLRINVPLTMDIIEEKKK